MRTRIGSPFLLTIIAIFSILFFATSVAAQSTSGEQCYSSKGREKDQLQNSSNPSSTNTKPKLVPESCGTTFDTYNPPAIACGANGNEPGVWLYVNRNGVADPTAQQSIGSCLNDGPGGYVDDCSLQNACDFAPPPNPDIKPVFVKPKDLEPSTENLLQSGVGDRYLKEDGTIQKIQMNYFTSLNVNKYNFQTAIWSNDQGEEYKDGIPVGGASPPQGNAPPVGNSSGMPPVGGQSPAEAELALATAAREQAEQQVNTAQGTFESAQSAVQTAQQTLTTAQETLVSVTSALQEAERAVEDETQQKAELIRVAEEAVQQAEQQLQTTQQELDSARSALAEAQTVVSSAEIKKDNATKTVNDARASLNQLMGGTGGGGSNLTPPEDGGNNQQPPVGNPENGDNDDYEKKIDVIIRSLQTYPQMGCGAPSESCNPGLFQNQNEYLRVRTEYETYLQQAGTDLCDIENQYLKTEVVLRCRAEGRFPIGKQSR